MAIMMNKETAFALDNLAMILQAQRNGLRIRPEDLVINYAELDHELTSREDEMVAKASKRILERVTAWLEGIGSPKDVTPEKMGLDEILASELLDHVKSVWAYGGSSADAELQQMGLAAAEDWGDLTNEDAYEWYDRYSRSLAASGQDALFIKMQPLILEALDQGLVRLALAQRLAADFARFGSVRADIIARTESNKAFNWGRRYRFDQSPVISGYRYSAIMDGRTTQICSGLHDHSWIWGDPDLDAYTPPNHYRCRSILVPISRYADFTFEEPATGWENSLPAAERKVLDKFKDTAWYPTPQNIRKMDVPKAGAVKPNIKPAAKTKKKPAAPKKKPAAASAAPAKSFLDTINARTDLTPEDKAAITRVWDLISKEDTAAKMPFARKILHNAGLDSELKSITQRKMKYNGFVKSYEQSDGSIKITDYVLLSDSADARPHHYKIKTALHEFYHANFNGLKWDRDRYNGIGDNWTRMEETATELSAIYMVKKVKGIAEEIAPSYSEYLIEHIPRLKQLPDFKDAKTLDDFGEKFLKYRFDDSTKSAVWGPLMREMDAKGIPAGYYDKYEDYVRQNKSELIDRVFDSLPQTDKLTSIAREAQIKRYISNDIDKGLQDRKKSNFAYRQAVLLSMDRMGVD